MENRFRQVSQKYVIVVLILLVMVLMYVSHFGRNNLVTNPNPNRGDNNNEMDKQSFGFHFGIEIDLKSSSYNKKFQRYKFDNRELRATLMPLLERTVPVAISPEDKTKRNTVYTMYNRDTWTAKRKLPQALIIGVKKGGTRALLEFIRLHPDVRAVGPETHFFDRNYHKGLQWYRRHMPASLEGQITMEKTPSYFVTKEVPRRVYNMSRDARLLVVVRDPVTRAISDYAQTMSKRRDLKPFEQLAFLDDNATTGLVDTSWAAIKLGVYARHLERWLQYFPLRQFHFVSGERLIDDPAGEMAKVQDFLGIRRLITDNHFYFNETKGFPCLKKSERNGGSPKCLGRTKGRPHPNIDQAVIQRLRDFYRPFNMKFYLMTGVNFEWP